MDALFSGNGAEEDEDAPIPTASDTDSMVGNIPSGRAKGGVPSENFNATIVSGSPTAAKSAAGPDSGQFGQTVRVSRDMLGDVDKIAQSLGLGENEEKATDTGDGKSGEIVITAKLQPNGKGGYTLTIPMEVVPKKGNVNITLCLEIKQKT
jgi:hypothetical protein